MKTIAVMTMVIGIVACCGCGGEISTPREDAKPPTARPVDRQPGLAVPQTPVVELKGINSPTPTQNQFRMKVHLPADAGQKQNE